MPRLIFSGGPGKRSPAFSLRLCAAETALSREAVSRGGPVMREKEKGKGGIRGGATIVLAVIVLVLCAGECRAFPYRPAAPLSLVSEYADLKSSAPPHTQVWQVVPETSPDGATVLRFFLEAAGEAGALCEVMLPPPGAAGEIRWTGKTGQKKSGAGMLLLPGFPAPCDVLPVDRQDGSGAYAERSEAGGRVFARSYRVSFTTSSVGEAKTLGWIRAEDPAGTELIMVSVTDDKGRPVVKQLWPADGSWWLYEETPLRRSWLIR